MSYIKCMWLHRSFLISTYTDQLQLYDNWKVCCIFRWVTTDQPLRLCHPLSLQKAPTISILASEVDQKVAYSDESHFLPHQVHGARAIYLGYKWHVWWYFGQSSAGKPGVWSFTWMLCDTYQLPKTLLQIIFYTLISIRLSTGKLGQQGLRVRIRIKPLSLFIQ